MTKLDQAISLIKVGNRKDAYKLLSEILRSDPNNEKAWLWMTAVVDENKRRFCLEKILDINPNNQQAKQGLAKLDKIKSPTPQASSGTQLSRDQTPPTNKPLATTTDVLGIKDEKRKRFDKVTLKPTISKIFDISVTITVVVLIIILLSSWDEFPDILSFLVVVIVTLIRTIVFSFIFFKLPYFKIEINNSHLIGPKSLGVGWQRIRIPISDIDIKSINSTFQWLGFYVMKSFRGKKLYIWGFDENQFDKLIGSLEEYKRNEDLKHSA